MYDSFNEVIGIFRENKRVYILVGRVPTYFDELRSLVKQSRRSIDLTAYRSSYICLLVKHVSLAELKTLKVAEENMKYDIEMNNQGVRMWQLIIIFNS